MISADEVRFRFDQHFDVRGLHVRSFTRRSLENLANAAGFNAKEFVGLGRLLYLRKSMFMRFECL